MKESFSCSLTGSRWWKPFLGFLVLFLLVFISMELATFRISMPGSTHMASSWLFVLVMFLLLVVIDSVFLVLLYRILYSTISFRNEKFSFTGEIGTFVKINVTGFLLSLITAGFYLPWYTKKVTDFLALHSVYREEKVTFSGKPGKLLKYYLLGLLLPLVVWSVVFISLVVAATLTAKHSTAGAVILGAVAGIVYIGIFFVIVPVLYLIYKWYVNFQWKDTHITWKTEFWASCRTISMQVFLTIITIGIYWPAMYIKLYRYFAGKTILEVAEKEHARLGFDGKTGSGFALIWGQTLLSILTLGIYLPWAIANCIRFFVNNTWLENTQTLIE